MSMNVTPGGTRGQRPPPTPLKQVLFWFMRTTHRLGARSMDGMPVILLTTRGARSGEQRSTPVMCFSEGDSAWLVVASFGGSARHPAWFVNMAHHPDEVWVEVEGRRVSVTPRTLAGEERERAWQRITTQSSRFAGYQQKTDREIPVVRLEATSPAAP
jgi:deazaflavin-dependent oxidoreductase (nitroreductase family)